MLLKNIRKKKDHKDKGTELKGQELQYVVVS